MKWTEIKVQVEGKWEELISNIFYDIGVKGLSIDDPNYLKNLEQNKEDWDYIDEELIKEKLDKLETNRVSIKAYFSEEEKPLEKLELFKKHIKLYEEIKEDDYDIYLKDVMEKDWSENWKKYYKPTRIGKNIVIKPSWEKYEKNEADIIIEIDPGMAFGTGTHETTSMCTIAIEKYLKREETLYDIGTGSGILSLVAGKLGASKVIGIDLDPTAVKVARENIKNNDLENKISIKEGDLFKILNSKADIIVANIIADIIIGMSENIKEYLKRDGIFITSGIIKSKEEDVKSALEANNFEIIEIMRMKEWLCIVARLE